MLEIWSKRFAKGPYQEKTPPSTVRLEPTILRTQIQAFYQLNNPSPVTAGIWIGNHSAVQGTVSLSICFIKREQFFGSAMSFVEKIDSCIKKVAAIQEDSQLVIHCRIFCVVITLIYD